MRPRLERGQPRSLRAARTVALVFIDDDGGDELLLMPLLDASALPVLAGGVDDVFDELLVLGDSLVLGDVVAALDDEFVLSDVLGGVVVAAGAVVSDGVVVDCGRTGEV